MRGGLLREVFSHGGSTVIFFFLVFLSLECCCIGQMTESCGQTKLGLVCI